jgi:hypothetical protein
MTKYLFSKPQRPSASAHPLRQKLIGTNPAPQVTGLEDLPSKNNYFIAVDPRIDSYFDGGFGK